MNKEDMPHPVITMGIGTILESGHALMITNGVKKAGIVAKALEGPITSSDHCNSYTDASWKSYGYTGQGGGIKADLDGRQHLKDLFGFFCCIK